MSGTLEAVLTYSSATQNGQGVDVTLNDAAAPGLTWAQVFSATETRVHSAVREGHTYHITLWYTFDGLEFELTTSLKPE